MWQDWRSTNWAKPVPVPIFHINVNVPIDTILKFDANADADVDVDVNEPQYLSAVIISFTWSHSQEETRGRKYRLFLLNAYNARKALM